MKLKISSAHAQTKRHDERPLPCLEVRLHRVDVLDRGLDLFAVAGSRGAGCGVVVGGVGDGCGERGEWWVKLSERRGKRALACPVRASN